MRKADLIEVIEVLRRSSQEEHEGYYAVGYQDALEAVLEELEEWL